MGGFLSDQFHRKNGKHALVLSGEKNNDLKDIDFEELERSATEVWTQKGFFFIVFVLPASSLDALKQIT